jgi:hypothetical protein
MLEQMGGHRVQHPLWHLCTRSIVEEDEVPGPLQRGELPTQGLRGEFSSIRPGDGARSAHGVRGRTCGWCLARLAFSAATKRSMSSSEL